MDCWSWYCADMDEQCLWDCALAAGSCGALPFSLAGSPALVFLAGVGCADGLYECNSYDGACCATWDWYWMDCIWS